MKTALLLVLTFVSLIVQNASALTPTSGPACTPMTIRNDDIGYEYFVGDTARIQHFVTDGGTAPFTFSAVTIPPGGTISPSGLLKFVPDHSGIGNQDFNYTVRATDSQGCTQDFTYNPTVMCNPIAMTDATFTNFKKGMYSEQAVPTAVEVHPPFTNYYVSPSEVPPGLSVSTNGIISGTPTAFGTFNFTVGYQGLGGCSGTTYVTLKIQNNAPVKTLYFYSLCAENDSVRNWKVYNQNNFNVTVNWATIYYNTFEGSFVAAPGDNFFSSPVVGGPNTVRIRWSDETGNTRSLVQPANNNRCDPPACVTGLTVDFYHQGQQRDGNHVAAEVSNPSSVLGAPDANDAANGAAMAFSLGFDGFINIQLNANLYDSPGNDLTVYEYSPNNPSFSNNPERAQVFASMDGIQWVSLGLTSPGSNCQQKMDTEFDLSGKLAWCRYIKVLDVSNRNARVLNASTCATTSALAFNAVSNGFDLDAVTCAGGSGTLSQPLAMINPLSREGGNPFYPNPAIDLVKVDFSRDQNFVYPENGEIDITIVDLSGTSVYQQHHVLDEQWTTECDISKLNSGLFVARVNAAGSSKVYKFMKK